MMCRNSGANTISGSCAASAWLPGPCSSSALLLPLLAGCSSTGLRDEGLCTSCGHHGNAGLCHSLTGQPHLPYCRCTVRPARLHLGHCATGKARGQCACLTSETLLAVLVLLCFDFLLLLLSLPAAACCPVLFLLLLAPGPASMKDTCIHMIKDRKEGGVKMPLRLHRGPLGPLPPLFAPPGLPMSGYPLPVTAAWRCSDPAASWSAAPASQPCTTPHLKP
jgi:hypothetical protein